MAELPLVLAGPILRRVTGADVTVWIALRDAAEVEVSVWAGPQFSTGALTVQSGAQVVANGKASTRQFGAKLHVAVVTAKTQATVIVPGAVHSYDVKVGAQGLQDLQLLKDETAGARLANVDPSAPLHLALGYQLDRLPSFATPAPILADLCLAHASCRRSNAAGPDALAFLDEVIRDNFTNIAQRPQQLFLTGDQIYADDLGACLQRQVNEIGTDMLGFTERLPIENRQTPVTLEEFPATRRRHLVREIARFTTSDGQNHLLSYGEFIAMHLLSWSPRLWRPLDTKDKVFVDSNKVVDNHLQNWDEVYGDRAKWEEHDLASFTSQTKNTEIFRAAIPRVARVLANCSTYMIWDDHEVTDDWYLSKSWRTRVLTAPFGRAVLRNAYLAYTLCQAWGNDPAAFTHEGAAPKPKNELLLDAMVKVGADKEITTATANTLDPLLGLGSPELAPEVSFHYSVPSPVHMVRVLDTRTRRTYKGRLGPPKLLGASLDAQLPAGPLTDGRELLVVISPAPALMPRLFDTLIQPLAGRMHDFFANVKQKAVAGPDGPPITGDEDVDVEGWGMDEDGLETLIQRLGTYTKAIVLSGDVHFASSVALDYWKGTETAVTSRIVQLTSSGARNMTGSDRQAVIRSARVSQQLLRNLPFERLAWKEKAPVVVPNGQAIAPGRRTRMRRSPSLLPAAGWPAGTTVPQDKPPDWRWRLTVLRDETPRALMIHPERLQPVLPTFDLNDPLGSYNRVALVHAEMALSPNELLRTMVFRSNVGVIRIEAAAGEQTLVHELFSVDAPNSTEGAPFTRHRTPLGVTPAAPPPQLQVVPSG